MSKQLRYSRWRRIQGLHRVTDQRLQTHRDEAQRLTLYLPGRLLDLAESLAIQSGNVTTQEYCESVLSRALEAEAASAEADRSRRLDGPLLVIDEVAQDVVFAQSTQRTDGLRLPGPRTASTSLPKFVTPKTVEADRFEAAVHRLKAEVEPASSSLAQETMLGCLRSGTPVGAAIAATLFDVLEVVAEQLRRSDEIPTGLCHLLFRLAFEPQVLLTEAWPQLAGDPTTLRAVRTVQELVESILGTPARPDLDQAP